jgi:hypothetical protein
MSDFEKPQISPRSGKHICNFQKLHIPFEYPKEFSAFQYLTSGSPLAARDWNPLEGRVTGEAITSSSLISFQIVM